MQVLLLQNVKKIGNKGDIKKVADGYARNFLIPRKLAKVATDQTVRAYKVAQDNRKKHELKEKDQCEKMAQRLKGYVLKMAMNAKDGRLFGSVSEKDVVKALHEDGFTVEEEHIELPKHIKETGMVEVVLKFPHGVRVTIEVDIHEK